VNLADAQQTPLAPVNPDEDGFLYHYTSLEAFTSIIQNKTMWASHARFCNDTSEQQIVKNLFLDGLRKRLEMYPPDLQSGARELFETWRDRFANASPFFLICFSEDGGDRLSQWRAYGGGSGICLRFKKAQLHNWIVAGLSERIAILKPVRYISPSGDEQLHAELDEILDSFKDPEQNTELAADVYISAAISKHRAFDEEKEWRMLVYSWNQQLRHRTRGPLLVPYIELDFGEALTDLVARVIVGPVPHREQVAVATKGMLEANGFTSTEVRCSETPYRGF
jgi:Protein of unknown function (DUF2971)